MTGSSSGELRLSETPALSRGDYDRSVIRRNDPEWLATAWKSARVLLLDPDGTVPIQQTDTGPRLALVPPAEIPDSLVRVFLGEDADGPYFAALDFTPAREAQQPEQWAGEARAGLRSVGALLDDVGSGLFTAAVALRNWHRNHPRCPRCGTPTEVTQAGWVRHCPADGSDHFPRTDPAVIMLVTDGADRCVLGRQAVWPEGRYSILAGFVDPGESAESAVAREVGEEVGIAVRDVRYVSSQPWPFPASIMLGFTARVDGDPTLHVDEDEIQHAQWFSKDEIRRRDGVALLPSPVSIAYRLITDWLEA
ncbi:MAG TPA: NAD(+) diphosphatase [Mycobacteriales bacterium]|nr:NAD(+) diphosphatase [Mycobacteriales bacterium]